MKAKKINEFHKGDDPLGSLSVGIKNYEQYIKTRCNELGYNPEEFYDSLWEKINEDNSNEEMLDMIIQLIKTTSIKVDIDFVKEEFEYWLEEK